MMSPAAPAHGLIALVRHGRAEPGEHGEDHARRLTRAGQEGAAAAGRWLAEYVPRPELVWCSSAVRARQTWEAMSASLQPAEVRVERDLYLAGPAQVLERLDDDASLVVVGHNPTLEQVLHALTGALAGLSPGAVALVDRGARRLVGQFDPPR